MCPNTQLTINGQGQQTPISPKGELQRLDSRCTTEIAFDCFFSGAWQTYEHIHKLEGLATSGVRSRFKIQGRQLRSHFGSNFGVFDPWEEVSRAWVSVCTPWITASAEITFFSSLCDVHASIQELLGLPAIRVNGPRRWPLLVK